MEFAYIYNAFGAEVTIVEMLDRILPLEDEEVSKHAQRAFKKQGMTIHTSSAVQSVERTDNGATVTFTKSDKEISVQAQKVLVAIGVGPRTDGLFDDSLGLELERGYIKTDAKTTTEPTYATNIPGVFAVGDIIGPPLLAHVASEEAVTCVERIAGHHTLGVDYSSIPGCTYTNPQVASIGKTEAQLKNEGVAYTKGVYSLKAHGKAIAVDAADGFVKLLASEKYGEILVSLAIRLEATVEDILSTMHAHPTMAESIHEAAMGTEGRMIHN